jgi:hypothetical protein
MLFNRIQSMKAVILRLSAIAVCMMLLLPDALHHKTSPTTSHQSSSPPREFNGAVEAAPDEFEDPDGRNDWFTFQRTYPFAAIPADARRRAWEALDRMRTESLVNTTAVRRWQPIGPSPTVSAYSANWGNTSGRINAIAVSPADTRLVLAGS